MNLQEGMPSCMKAVRVVMSHPSEGSMAQLPMLHGVCHPGACTAMIMVTLRTFPPQRKG